MGRENTHAATASREPRRGRKAVYKHTHTHTHANQHADVSLHVSLMCVKIYTFQKTTGKKSKSTKIFHWGRKKNEFPTTQTRTKWNRSDVTLAQANMLKMRSRDKWDVWGLQNTKVCGVCITGSTDSWGGSHWLAPSSEGQNGRI